MTDGLLARRGSSATCCTRTTLRRKVWTRWRWRWRWPRGSSAVAPPCPPTTTSGDFTRHPSRWSGTSSGSTRW